MRVNNNNLKKEEKKMTVIALKNNKGYVTSGREDALKVIKTLAVATLKDIVQKAMEMHRNGKIEGRLSVPRTLNEMIGNVGGWRWYDWNDRIRRIMKYWEKTGRVQIITTRGQSTIYEYMVEGDKRTYFRSGN